LSNRHMAAKVKVVDKDSVLIYEVYNFTLRKNKINFPIPT